MKTRSENVAAKMSDLQIEAVCGHLRDYYPKDIPFNGPEHPSKLFGIKNQSEDSMDCDKTPARDVFCRTS